MLNLYALASRYVELVDGFVQDCLRVLDGLVTRRCFCSRLFPLVLQVSLNIYR